MFGFFRILFIAYNFSYVKNEGFRAILLCFKYAFPLDVSMFGYFTLCLTIPLFYTFLFSKNWNNAVLKFCIALFSFLYVCCSITELFLFKEWGTKLSFKAIAYLTQPAEILSTAGPTTAVFAFTGIIIFSLFFYKVLFVGSIINCTFLTKKSIENVFYIFLIVIFNITLSVLCIRGGTSQIPIQSSICYYSHNNTLNLVAVNNLWNVAHVVIQNQAYLKSNPFQSIDSSLATAKLNLLYTSNTQADTLFLLSNTKPNIVFILMESMSADCMYTLGGDSNYATNLDKLAKQGVSFTNIFASGTRSDEGVGAVFSGYPDLPKLSIISQQSKYVALPSLYSEFKKQNYYTSFYFGGQLEYENIQSYLIHHQADKLMDIKNFKQLPQGHLGIHDEYMFPQFLNDIKAFPQPFFASFFTTSTHPPFDVPKKIRKVNTEFEHEYLESVIYSDSCIGAFIQQAKTQIWYNNTLFVLISDHSRRTHKQHPWNYPADRHIPFILFGNVIKPPYRGLQINKIGSQTDVAKTLLYQLNMPTRNFKWSKNLCNPTTKDFAFMSHNEGFTWINKNDTLSYYYQNFPNYFNAIHSNNKDSITSQGKAYLQKAFNQFIHF